MMRVRGYHHPPDRPQQGKAPSQRRATLMRQPERRPRDKGRIRRPVALLSRPDMDPPAHDLFDMIERIYRYARRWAVGQSSRPEHAVIYDACVDVINEHCAPLALGPTSPSAKDDRYLRYGAESPAAGFTLPIAVEDAAEILHRYARRYTNGRGSFTAAVVNSTAKDLIAAGISLARTRELDGTHWAADGTSGQHDGLTPSQRTEALDALPATESGRMELSVL